MRYIVLHKGSLLSLKQEYGLVFEILGDEAGFDSNWRVERSGEGGSDVRTNRPSLLLSLRCFLSSLS